MEKQEKTTRKKAKNGEGSVCLRSDGRYMVRISIEGKRISRYAKTERQAYQILEKLTQDAAQGLVRERQVTMKAWLKEWLELYIRSTVKQSTYLSYRGYIENHINPVLGEMQLSQIKQSDLQRFFHEKSQSGRVDRKSGGLSAKTLRNMYNMLHAAFEQAILSEEQLLKKNPIIGVKLGRVQTKEMRVLSETEQKQICTVVDRMYGEEQNYPLFGILFALNTGVRIGELLALKWIDVDMDKRTIKIRRTIQRLQKIDAVADGENSTELVIESPKTVTGIRTIPVFPKLWKDLMEYQERQKAFSMKYIGCYDAKGFMFCNLLGNAYEPRTYADLFQRVLAQAGVSGVTFHILRHTFATRAIEAGMDIKVLAAILGHAQASTTLNRYGHVLPDHKVTSMARMEKFYE